MTHLEIEANYAYFCEQAKAEITGIGGVRDVQEKTSQMWRMANGTVSIYSGRSKILATEDKVRFTITEDVAWVSVIVVESRSSKIDSLINK